jgi:transposase
MDTNSKNMNSNALQELNRRRNQILEQMRNLDQMRRGSLSRQFFRSPTAKATEKLGPYFVLQGYQQGQKFSQRIPEDQAVAVETQVANYKQFQALADEFVTITEQLTLQSVPDSKKNSMMSFSKSSSGKPKPSCD